MAGLCLPLRRICASYKVHQLRYAYTSAYLGALCLVGRLSTLFSFYSNVDRSMGDSADVRGSVKSFDEKNSLEDTVAPTRITSAADLIRFLSQKLLTWGVEARGAYHISNAEPGRPDQRAPCGILRTAFVRLPPDRYPSCRRRG